MPHSRRDRLPDRPPPPAGVNPLAGCLPTLATIPVFIGLYHALSNAAKEGLLEDAGFFWIPSLGGPTTIVSRQLRQQEGQQI